MTASLRLLAAFTTALALVLMGQAAAMAPAAHDADHRMVICTGNGTVMILPEGEHAPADLSHLCPDCTLSALQSVGDASFGLHAPNASCAVKAAPVSALAEGRTPAISNARDPPDVS